MTPGTHLANGAETAPRAKEAELGHPILVVDDEEDALLSARALLEREGHRVFTASNGEDALELFKNRDIHLMVIDYVMPGMNGEELIRRIREVDSYVQILLQTASTEQAPPRRMLADLDIQGYHDKTDGSRRLLLWVQAGLRAYQTIATLRERERQQSEMVAQVSHEIKNPIGLIRGFTELLLDGAFGEIPPAAQTPLKSLGATVHNLNELVGNFLLYAKTQAGAMPVDRRWVSAGELLDGVRAHARLLLACKTLDFSVEVQDPLEVIFTDAPKVLVIVRNLLDNAVKFTARGSISVRANRDGGLLRVSVSDTGPGIEPGQQALVFEPFRQLDGSITRAFGGIGLGLALSRKLACLLAGDLQLESKVGEGSTFTLFLPAGDAAHAPAGSPSGPADSALPRGGLRSTRAA
jgi:signal transduction histidine kinase